MSLAQINPFEFMTDTNGDPLDAGYIYIGVENLDPETNPISVYYDSAMTIPVSQPIRTVAGFVLNAGLPAVLYVRSACSTRVRNRNLVQIYHVPSSSVMLVSNPIMTSLSASSGAALVGYSGSSTYAAATLGATINDSAINVKDFPWLAKLDGVADDGPAIQAAITYNATKSPNCRAIYIPGTARIATPITISTAMRITGNLAGVTNGSRFISDMNNVMFTVTAGVTFDGVSFIGTNNAANTSEIAVKIENTNNVKFQDCGWLNSYKSIVFSGSSPCFYASFTDCVFQTCNHSFIQINNTSDAGVDLILTGVRFVGAMPTRCWDFTLGLGSIIGSNVQMSVTGSGPTGQLCLFGTPAPLYGGIQFSASVFESKGPSIDSTPLYFLGTSTRSWNEAHFDNCLITSNGPSSAIVYGYAEGITYTNCTISSLSTQRNILHLTGKAATGIKYIGCNFEQSNSVPVMSSDGDCIIDMHVVTPKYTGSAAFMDFRLVTTTNLSLAITGGGNVGTAASPVLLADITNTVIDFQNKGAAEGLIKRKIVNGSLTSGGVTFAHGISNGQQRILSVAAYYRGSSGEALPMNLVNYDGINVVLSGGVGTAKYRAYIEYTTKIDTNWV